MPKHNMPTPRTIFSKSSRLSSNSPVHLNHLKSLSLNNFKSVMNQEVPLSPLTILVGANSAGKSSLIQSLLFMAQNAESPTRDSRVGGTLQLNGDLVGLGTYRETLFDGAASDENIWIGGRLQILRSSGSELQFFESENLLHDKSGVLPIISNSRIFEWGFGFRESAIEDGSGVVESIRAEGKVFLANELVQEISVNFEDNPVAHESQPTIDWEYNLDRSGEITTYGSLESVASSETLWFVNLPKRIQLKGLQYLLGLPINGVAESDRLEVFLKSQNNYFRSRFFRRHVQQLVSESMKKAQDKVDYEMAIMESLPDQVDVTFRDESQAAEKYIELILGVINSEENLDSYLSGSNLLRKSLIPLEALPIEFPFRTHSEELVSIKVSELSRFFATQGPKQVSLPLFSRLVAEEVGIFWDTVEELTRSRIKKLTGGLKNQPYYVPPAMLYETDYESNFSLPDPEEFPVGDAVVHLNSFFKGVRYLGPLREEPQDIYPRNMGIKTEQMPLGKAGGYLAQVIYENPMGPFPTPGGHTLLFKDALNEWLKFLEVCKTGVSSRTESHYGFKLTVDGKALRMMGTGVSQVLPVVAICLLATRKDERGLVLLEEPELHLNPSVQQKLAEFFLAMSEAGVQIIAETHSEYLITRLRLIAAKDPSLAQQFSFIFAEREMEAANPRTIYREVKASANGELPAWPKGFFDQVSLDVRALIVELANKKMENRPSSTE